MIRAFLIQLLCLGMDVHDTFPKQSGTCKRCGLEIDDDGNAVVR